jgi:hypothetical protein
VRLRIANFPQGAFRERTSWGTTMLLVGHLVVSEREDGAISCDPVPSPSPKAHRGRRLPQTAAMGPLNVVLRAASGHPRTAMSGGLRRSCPPTIAMDPATPRGPVGGGKNAIRRVLRLSATTRSSRLTDLNDTAVTADAARQGWQANARPGPR